VRQRTDGNLAEGEPKGEGNRQGKQAVTLILRDGLLCSRKACSERRKIRSIRHLWPNRPQPKGRICILINGIKRQSVTIMLGKRQEWKEGRTGCREKGDQSNCDDGRNGAEEGRSCCMWQGGCATGGKHRVKRKKLRKR